MIDLPITLPAVEPLALSVVKHHLRVEIDDDDTLIAGLLAAARADAEHRRNAVAVVQTRELIADRFPREFRFWRLPVLAVLSVSYVDASGAAQTLDPAQYQLDRDSRPARLRPVSGTYWPQAGFLLNAVRVRYVAGCLIPFTVSVADDTLTTHGYSLADADAVQLSNSGGALPMPLQERTTYYVVNAVAATCQLATEPAGEPITLSTAGEGLHFVGALPPGVAQWLLLDIGARYAVREAVTDRTYTAVPGLLDGLLADFGVEVLD